MKAAEIYFRLRVQTQRRAVDLELVEQPFLNSSNQLIERDSP
jgi:hypothetical protein